MNITIKSSAIKDLCTAIDSQDNCTKRLNDLSRDLVWKAGYYTENTDINIDLDKYSVDELVILKEAFKRIRARKITKTIDMLINALSDTDNAVFTDLQIFGKALVKYVDENTEHKWLFKNEKILNNEYNVPYLMYHVHYEREHYDKDKYYYEPYISVEIHTNGLKSFERHHIVFTQTDIENRTINQILAQNDIFIETKELYDEYVKTDTIYKQRIKEQGKQYKCYKYAIRSKESWYSDHFKSVSNSDNMLEFFHVVNDTTADDRHVQRTESCHLYENIDKCEIPVLPFIVGYNLDSYCDCYFHVDDIEDYTYDHTLKEKLVLPVSHKNLLDILVNNSNILRGDIINNKGNGTVVILEGPPGCGKTLTTEVYAELIEKPLYKVSSGQLGVDAKDMDKNLYNVLNRAARLGCILLIDECETFVRKRNDNLMQNAIITTFLRRLEYFDGIMFLTSNKINDIDDAILSRCIAAIRYEPPTEENAKKIWTVLAKQFNLDNDVNTEMINKLVKVFPNAVGRDIKELLKLTARYCIGTNEKMSITAFLTCAQFKYIDVDEKYVESLNE